MSGMPLEQSKVQRLAKVALIWHLQLNRTVT